MVDGAAFAMATMAAAPAPPGHVTNFVDPPSQQGAMIAVCSVLVTLTLLFVCLRLYSSFLVTRSPGAEDYFCIAATVLSFTYVGLILHLSYAARHMWDVPVLWFNEEYWKLRFAQNILQAVAFFTSRLPIFLLYRRLFGPNKRFRYLVYFGIAASFAVYMSNVPLIAYFCAPPPGKSWVNQNVFAKSLDIFTLILPMRLIWGLNLPLKKKIGLFAIFTTGFFAVIASVISLYYRYQLTYGNDVNWNEGAFVTSVAVEINVVIICGSMPACSSLLKRMSEKFSFFPSMWSALGHYSRFASGRSNLKTPSSDYNKPTQQKRSGGSGDSGTYLAHQGFISPQDQYTKWQPHCRNPSYSQCHITHGRQNAPHGGKGITKTVEVNVV